MSTVNMLKANTNLSRLVEAVESGAEADIVIARNGRPAGRLVPVRPLDTGRRIGIAKGKFVVPESLDDENEAIAMLFNGSPA